MLRKVCAAAALSLAFTGLGHSAAPAVDLHKSRLSAIELKQCRVLRKHSDGGAWLCRGIRGFPVYFAEGDLRRRDPPARHTTND